MNLEFKRVDRNLVTPRDTSKANKDFLCAAFDTDKLHYGSEVALANMTVSCSKTCLVALLIRLFLRQKCTSA